MALNPLLKSPLSVCGSLNSKKIATPRLSRKTTQRGLHILDNLHNRITTGLPCCAESPRPDRPGDKESELKRKLTPVRWSYRNNREGVELTRSLPAGGISKGICMYACIYECIYSYILSTNVVQNNCGRAGLFNLEARADEHSHQVLAVERIIRDRRSLETCVTNL